MFVFIHGTLATQSLWLPQIRSILSLGREYSDQELINTFTLQLPGHPDKDHSFAYKDFKVILEEFQKNQFQKQLAMSRQMLLKGDREVVQYLQNKKLTLIGHAVGGALSLEYAIKNSSNVQKLVLCSTPVRFNKTYLRFISTILGFLKNINPKFVLKLAVLMPFRRWKVAAHILSVNPKQKSVRSCVDYLLAFDFKNLYHISSLNQQLALSNVPILLIGGSRDITASARSVHKLKEILTAKAEIITTKKTIIKGHIPNPDPARVIIYNAGHNQMDTKITEFAEDVREFLFRQ